MGLWNWIKENTTTIVATVITGIATGGTSLIVQAVAIGGAYIIGSAIDDDKKKQENEKKQLDLKGEISKEIREQINSLQEDRSQKAGQLNNFEQQLAQKQAKLNDPNTPEHEKAQIRSEIASMISQRDSIQREIKTIDDKINGLISSAQKTIAGSSGSLINMDNQTKMIVVGGIVLLVYLMAKDNKD